MEKITFQADTGSGWVKIRADQDGFIEKISACKALAKDTTQRLYRTAGLIDLQINGFAGVDFNTEHFRYDALDAALKTMVKTGVTQCLPTLITASEESLTQRFCALDSALSETKMGNLIAPGYHLEGPFLNPEPGYCGAHPPDQMIAGDWGLIERLEARLDRPILLITVAPEQKGVLEVIKEGARRGKIMAIGHANTDIKSLKAAVEAGALMSTHLGNGLPQILPRTDNPLIRQLAEDRLFASFIPDNIHVPPESLKVFLRAKTTDRAILVTDATAGAACPPGKYHFAGNEIEVAKDGKVTYPGTDIMAGSSARLDQGIRNIINSKTATAEQALKMACANPARLLDQALKAHNLRRRAAFVDWDENWQVQDVTIAGL